MRKDLIKHIEHCPTCQKTAPVKQSKTPPTGSLWANRPIARLNVDAIAPLNKDNNDNKYLLVFVDSFTRYTILVSLKEVNALEVADALIWNVCAIFGIPMSIHNDNGPEFANEIFKLLCQRMSIKMSTSIPYHSESNGFVERKHRDVIQCIRKLLIDYNDYHSWSTYVPITQLLINSTKSRITNHTPYELKFGSSTSPRSDPADILGGIFDFESNVPLLQDLKFQIERLQ
ncbi:hypothetical protein P9112_003662 [Eukaryota sp. TZLM1-RC]